MNEQDVRWEQRFGNYKKALEKLENAITYIAQNFDETELFASDKRDDVLDDLVKQGVIQSFEYTHELAWNVMKDYAMYQGNANVHGSRDASREAFNMGLIRDGDVWMEMIVSRNKTSHTYDKHTATEIFRKVINEYFPAFNEFRDAMAEIQHR